MSKNKLSDNVTGEKTTRMVISSRKDKFIDVDKNISAMARKGQLNYLGENAVKKSLRKGLSVTVMEDDGIYKIHPDGSKIRVKKQSQIYRDANTGKFYTKK